MKTKVIRRLITIKGPGGEPEPPNARRMNVSFVARKGRQKPMRRHRDMPSIQHHKRADQGAAGKAPQPGARQHRCASKNAGGSSRNAFRNCLYRPDKRPGLRKKTAPRPEPTPEQKLTLPTIWWLN
jgi:hypothetical protein